MPEQLEPVLAEVRTLLLDPTLLRAVAAGRRKGQRPAVVRAELRPVALKGGPRLQIVSSDGTRPHTRNAAPGPEAEQAVDELLAEPFGNWHVETATATVQVRVTKSGEAQVHRAAADRPVAEPAEHDRTKNYLIDPGDEIFSVVGGSAAKRRQVDAFLRALAATLPDELPDRLRAHQRLFAHVQWLRQRLLANGYRETTIPNNHPARKRRYFLDGEDNEWEFVEYLGSTMDERNDYKN